MNISRQLNKAPSHCSVADQAPGSHTAEAGWKSNLIVDRTPGAGQMLFILSTEPQTFCLIDITKIAITKQSWSVIYDMLISEMMMENKMYSEVTGQ